VLTGRRILLVDDDPVLLRVWSRTLSQHGLIVRTVVGITQARQALSGWRRRPFQYVLVDDQLADGFGLDLLPLLSELRPAPGFAVVSAHPSTERSLRAWQNASVIVPKPVSPAGLFQLLCFLESRRGRARKHRYRRSGEVAEAQHFGRFILDAHNVYQDMAAFPQASLGDRVFYRLTRRRQARMEAACWARAAHVIFCSAVDRDRAERLLPGVAAKSSIVPNCVDVGRFTPRPPAAFARGGPVLFMGTTRYPPNFFAIQEICRDVAPALPDLEFHIVGDAVWAPAVVPPNVRFLGRVESTAEPLAAAQVAIAPVRHGSGTRLKLLEYFAAGLPVVCTAKAAEGIAVEDGRHLRLVDTPTEMVAAVRALHADAPACAALGAAARALVRERYDWRAQVPGLLEVYAARASD